MCLSISLQTFNNSYTGFSQSLYNSFRKMTENLTTLHFYSVTVQ